MMQCAVTQSENTGRSVNGFTLLKVWGSLLAALALWWGMCSAWKMGQASLTHSPVRHALHQWADNPPDKTDYLRAKLSAQMAINQHPEFPLYLDTLGQVLEWGVIRGFEPESSLLKAEALYLESVSLRPHWPATWAALAMLKWRKGELDEEMQYYLGQAHQVGPASAQVHLLFVELGLALYQHNNVLFRPWASQIKQHTEWALRHPLSRKRALERIADLQAGDTICHWLAESRGAFKSALDCSV